MHLVVGLGNPGPKYQANRHNVGFMVVDELARRCSAEAFRDKFSGLFSRCVMGGNDVVLLKPQTYMNLSGSCVQKAQTFFKVPLSNVVVIHDELDLEFGVVRVKVGGGTAGHNGLKSMLAECGGPDFTRIRVGIGRPRGATTERHVLSDFSRDECSALSNVLEGASLAATDVVSLGAQPAMNRHNQAPNPPKNERVQEAKDKSQS